MREGEMDEDSEGMGGEVEEKGEGVVEEEDLSRILQSPDLGSGDRTLISGNHPSSYIMNASPACLCNL
jgi:hypothetical protein